MNKTNLSATELISRATQRGIGRVPPPAAIAEIAAILKHNDAAPKNKRVTANECRLLLKQHGWDYGEDSFKKWVCEHFDRAKWNRK